MKKVYSFLSLLLLVVSPILADENPEVWIKKTNDALKQSEQVQVSNKSIHPGYSQDGINKALVYLDTAVTQFPYRLDLWLGMVQIYGLVGDCDSQLKILEKVESLLKTSFDKCRLKGDRKVPSVEYLLENEYRNAIGNHWEEENDRCFELLSRKMYSIMPHRVEATNFMAVHYMLNKNDSALIVLEKALKTDPKDCVILGNMVNYYGRKKDVQKRKEYEVRLKVNGCQ